MITHTFSSMTKGWLLAACFCLTVQFSSTSAVLARDATGSFLLAQATPEDTKAAERKRKRLERQKANQEKRKQAQEAKRQRQEQQRAKAEERKRNQQAKQRANQEKRKQAQEAKRKRQERQRAKAEERKRQQEDQQRANQEKRKQAEDRKRKRQERQRAKAEERERNQQAEQNANQEKRKQAEDRKRKREERQRAKAEERERNQQAEQNANQEKRKQAEDRKRKREERQRAKAEERKREQDAQNAEQDNRAESARQQAEKRKRQRRLERLEAKEQRKLKRQENRIRKAEERRRKRLDGDASRNRAETERLEKRRNTLRRELQRDRRQAERRNRRERGERRLERQQSWERKQARRERRNRRRDFAFHRRSKVVKRRDDRVILSGIIGAAAGALATAMFVHHNDDRRFGWRAKDFYVEPVGNGWTRTVVRRADRSRVVTIRDSAGFVVRRYRVYRDGRRVFYYNNQPGWWEDNDLSVNIDPVRVSIPRDRYIVEPSNAPVERIYSTVTSGPVDELDRTYTLNQVLVSPRLRNYMPRIDLDTITFASGSADIPIGQIEKLETIGVAIEQAIKDKPEEVFLIEGHTDATGSNVANLDLSDRRAAAVADVLTNYYGIPPENLVTQGYGEQFLKVDTLASEQANRRVAVRRITPLLSTDNKQLVFDEDGNETFGN